MLSSYGGDFGGGTHATTASVSLPVRHWHVMTVWAMSLSLMMVVMGAREGVAARSRSTAAIGPLPLHIAAALLLQSLLGQQQRG